jgi:hypothetical protein
MTLPGPSLPIPDPLRGNESGTWAEQTLKVRMPDIGRRAVRERDWPTEIGDALARLAEDIPFGKVSPIDDPGAPDAEAWRAHVAPYEGMTWLDVPWFFSEAYFYRRILSASRFFQNGPTQELDPFGPEKRRGLDQSIRENSPTQDGAGLQELLLNSLWGNRADLSLWPTEPSEAMDSAAGEGEMSHLLVDHRLDVGAYLSGKPGGPGRIDLVLDNVGKELLADLFLVSWMADTWPQCRVRLHVKPHPWFVSDAVRADVETTLREVTSAGGPAAAAAESLSAAQAQGRMELVTDDYWTSPNAGWEMPPGLRRDLSGSDLVIFKGDANYRRMLGDRHWAYTTPIGDILSYFPAPALFLRSLKADVAAGLDVAGIESAVAADPEWMIDGQWAVIQFAGRP